VAEQSKSSIKLPKVSQLGYVVADIDKACKYYESMLGIGPFCSPFEVDMSGAIFKGKSVQTKIKVAFVQSGDVQIELIQPLDGNNPYTEYLTRHGDGIHHLGFAVTDMDGMKAEFAAAGLQLVFHHDMGVMQFAYYDTSAIGGVMTELLCYKTDIPGTSSKK
jgi:methylmalonyl-CoA/ethylmalonyl-CoA epimerase